MNSITKSAPGLVARLVACSVACAVVGACGGSSAQDETEATSDGSPAESGTDQSDTGFGDADACEGSDDCEAGFCVAAWDGSPPRGPAVCVDACVTELDLQLFCIDDASCCDGLSCSVDGLCEAPWTEDTGDGDGD